MEERGRGTTSVGILLMTVLSSRHLGPKVVSDVPKVLGDEPSCLILITSDGLGRLGWVEGSVRVVTIVDEEREHSDGL